MDDSSKQLYSKPNRFKKTDLNRSKSLGDIIAAPLDTETAAYNLPITNQYMDTHVYENEKFFTSHQNPIPKSPLPPVANDEESDDEISSLFRQQLNQEFRASFFGIDRLNDDGMSEDDDETTTTTTADVTLIDDGGPMTREELNGPAIVVEVFDDFDWAEFDDMNDVPLGTVELKDKLR